MVIRLKCLREIVLLLLGSLSIAAATVHAQYQIKSWTTDDGLPQNTVHSIVQTPDGYLWLATLDGLARYDGVRFTVFNQNNTKGIESNRFTQLLVDANGDLWVGTETGGASKLYTELETIKQLIFVCPPERTT